MEFETPETDSKYWGIFLYLSPNCQERVDQWQYLVDNKDQWGNKWFLGGEINDIRKADKKRGGRVRSKASFWKFRNFIDEMGMTEISFKGRPWTWANNREDKGFVKRKVGSFLCLFGLVNGKSPSCCNSCSKVKF